MPYELIDLVVNRVDLVDEGANSAAFIELYKRKENNEPMDFEAILKSLKPEHASVVQGVIDTRDADLKKAREDLQAVNQSLTDVQGQLKDANDALAKAKAELDTLKAKEYCECDGEEGDDGMCKACGKPKKKSAAFDETETLKSMPEPARTLFMKMRAQKEAAEEQVRKNNEEKAEAAAIAKAASLKAIPVEQSKLVGILNIYGGVFFAAELCYFTSAEIVSVPAAYIRTMAEIYSACIVAETSFIYARLSEQHDFSAHLPESWYGVFDIPKAAAVPDIQVIERGIESLACVAVVLFELEKNCFARIFFKELAAIGNYCRRSQLFGKNAFSLSAIGSRVNGNKAVLRFFKSYIKKAHSRTELLINRKLLRF